jgi:hypothetical protein
MGFFFREVNAVRGKPFYLIPALALVLFASGALAGDEKNQAPKPSAAKRMSPVKALQDAVKNLAKAQSYRADCTIEGGLSDREDHEVTERTVGESYSGEVFTSQPATLMHVPKVKAYRFPKKGVVYVEGAWRNILTYPETVRLDRLFTFPEVILARALTNAPKGARWLEPKKEDQDDSDEDSDESDEESDTKVKKENEKASPGKTVARPSESKPAEGPQPRVVHIDVPPEEALKSFIEAQNSGCMSAG